MSKRDDVGGVVHVYQKYNPVEFPSPLAESPDLVSNAFEHALAYGNYRELTEEELARAVHLDPSQIAGFGPSIEALRAMLAVARWRNERGTAPTSLSALVPEFLPSEPIDPRTGQPMTLTVEDRAGGRGG
jgi:hypothetical protein